MIRHLLHFLLAVTAVTFGLFVSSERSAGQCPCPICPICMKNPPKDLVNISSAKAAGKLQIDANGDYFVAGKNRKVYQINLICIEQTSGNKTKIQAGTQGGMNWSVAMGALPAGTYDCSAEIITCDNCCQNLNQKTTPSDPKQTIKGVVIKACCGESLDSEDLLVRFLFMHSLALAAF